MLDWNEDFRHFEAGEWWTWDDRNVNEDSRIWQKPISFHFLLPTRFLLISIPPPHFSCLLQKSSELAEATIAESQLNIELKSYRKLCEIKYFILFTFIFIVNCHRLERVTESHTSPSTDSQQSEKFEEHDFICIETQHSARIACGEVESRKFLILWSRKYRTFE